MTSDYEGDDDIIACYENQGSDGEDNNVEGVASDNDTDTRTARKIQPPVPKRHVTRDPIPKLNTERLKGPKGIQIIETYFEGFKFHGKGHEKADLDRMMKRLEHWSYRLFPKYHFDDFLARVEQLGAKKDLQVYIKKYRLDMLTSDNDLIVQDNMDNEEDRQESAPFDDLDLLITEQIQKQKQTEAQTSTSAARTNISNENAFDQLLMQSDNVPNTQTVSTAKNEWNDEIKERIERNKQLAIQRRLQKQKEREEEAKRKKTKDVDVETLNEDGNPTIRDETRTSLIDGVQSPIDKDTNEATCVDGSEGALFDTTKKSI